jgi:4'-phosphopantetheinyl transferase
LQAAIVSSVFSPYPEPGEVHLWFAQVNLTPDVLQQLNSTLSNRERERANRFAFERHKVRYVFAQGVLRDVLSRATGIAPAEIEFTGNLYGKPFLKTATGAATLQFNLSHSADLVAVGLVEHRAIGVDVEYIRPVLDLHSVAEDNYTPGEFDSIRGSPGEAQNGVFFRYWTRKESYIKAVGKGLSIPLNTFDTRFDPGTRGRRLGRTIDAPHVESWWIEDLAPPQSYAGAVTVEKGLESLRYFEWRPRGQAM